MKYSELNKVLCIFLLAVIVLPLFSSFFNIKEGNTSTPYCIVNKITPLTADDINDKKLKLATTKNQGGCDRLDKTDKCDEFYVKF